ncbi:hypothetical protein KP509_09G095300 [Ceratopteris richardii]|uniref:Uncharacterized protein n=1 Tax=Ceratopteris richardii TaxID=49495 RepID=A0A8T2U9S9_CERRI|nr:hypothetical protein KP509_09G095300 [Ceratopteris richardii]KAH7430357.1 hypothetical protein KP509_09G095300 [Ceratopteris richardii]KAH7430358.1 hypothetical protein KP509_09G095300 [Ceratopteris richardii]
MLKEIYGVPVGQAPWELPLLSLLKINHYCENAQAFQMLRSHARNHLYRALIVQELPFLRLNCGTNPINSLNSVYQAKMLLLSLCLCQVPRNELWSSSGLVKSLCAVIFILLQTCEGCLHDEALDSDGVDPLC